MCLKQSLGKVLERKADLFYNLAQLTSRKRGSVHIRIIKMCISWNVIKEEVHWEMPQHKMRQNIGAQKTICSYWSKGSAAVGAQWAIEHTVINTRCEALFCLPLIKLCCRSTADQPLGCRDTSSLLLMSQSLCSDWLSAIGYANYTMSDYAHLRWRSKIKWKKKNQANKTLYRS